MRCRRFWAVVVTVTSLGLLGCSSEENKAETPSANQSPTPSPTATPTPSATTTPAAGTVTWADSISGIVAARCGTSSCHGTGSFNRIYVGSETLFKAQKSSVLSRVTTLKDMPPAGSSQAAAMTTAERDQIKTYLAQ